MSLAAVTSEQEAILSLRGLRVFLPGGQGRCELIKGVDLDLYAGRITGLVGESGCGKTMTANALLGLLPYPEAQVKTSRFTLRANGCLSDLSAMNEAGWRRLRGRHLAMIFQEPQSALDPVFRIGRQMVRVISRQRQVDSAQARKIAKANLKDCGLADADRVLDSHPHQLSGGMRQRVMIALALACEPAVLVADEPTSALDIASRDQVLSLLRHAARERGLALLLIAHDLAAVSQICDDLRVMYAGRLVEGGPASQVLNQPQHPYTAALLQATARVAAHPPTLVQPIPGRAAALARSIPGCAFAERCAHATQRCDQHQPEAVALASRAGFHCCFHPLGEH